MSNPCPDLFVFTPAHPRNAHNKRTMKVTILEGNKAGVVKAICRFVNCKDVVDYEIGTVALPSPRDA